MIPIRDEWAVFGESSGERLRTVSHGGSPDENGIKGEERFGLGSLGNPPVTGAPGSEQCGLASGMDCRVTEVVWMATHSVFFGIVVEVASRAASKPLLYVHGTYGTFSPDGAGLWW